jgi:hypothetical protein
VLDHVAPDVDLAGGPVCRVVQDHPGLRPHQLVGPSNADLLKTDEFLRLKPGANPTKPVFTTTIREPILTNS